MVEQIGVRGGGAGMQLRKSIAFLFLLFLGWSSSDDGVFADPWGTSFIFGVLVDKGLRYFISILEDEI